MKKNELEKIMSAESVAWEKTLRASVGCIGK